MNKQEILFSIIVPYYNIIESLKKLLSGITDYEDVQVIVVDDRSDSKIEEYFRVRELYRERGVLFLKNDGVKGAGSCRNLGMKYAVGKWILFSDADDFFTETFHNSLLDYADSCADLIYFKPASVFIDTLKPAERHVNYERKLLNYLKNPCHENELHLKYDHASPCSKMFSRTYLESRKLQFEEIMYSNDSYFSITSAFYASDIEVSDQTIYCITDREGSLTKSTDLEAIQIRFGAFVRGASFLKKHLSKEDWKSLHINAMGRLMIIFQQGAGIKILLGLTWKCICAGIPFWDLSKLNKKTFLSTFFRIYISNHRKQKDSESKKR